jgi:hypothetical protein
MTKATTPARLRCWIWWSWPPGHRIKRGTDRDHD